MGKLAEWPGRGGDTGPRTPLAARVAKTVGLSGAEKILLHSGGKELTVLLCSDVSELRGLEESRKWEEDWLGASGALCAHGDDCAEGGIEPRCGLFSDEVDRDGWPLDMEVFTVGRLAGDHDRENDASMKPRIGGSNGPVDASPRTVAAEAKVTVGRTDVIDTRQRQRRR